ncbi:MAG: RNA-binding cell elongation regulator Jag/EloR [Christensenellales bacterium]|jgi:spoIIIJ-associated protein|nr:KH domain-containing protein [Clostridiales bacterium]
MKKESYEFKDVTVDLATEKGLKYLGVKRSDVELNIKNLGGLFKKACVEITPLEGVEVHINEAALEETPEKEEKKESQVLEETLEKEEKQTTLEESKEKSEKKEEETDLSEEEIILKNPATQEDMDLAFAKAKEFIDTVVTLLDAGCSVDYEKGYDSIKVVIDDGNLSKVIGHRGETLDALQYLSSCVANLDTEGFVRVQIDAGNYREKRTESLVRLANNLAKRCIKTKRSQKIEPMNSYERRIIHLALKENEKVETESLGEGPLKEIVIKYKKRTKTVDGETVVEEEITYGPSSEFAKKGTQGFRSFGQKRRRF